MENPEMKKEHDPNHANPSGDEWMRRPYRWHGDEDYRSAEECLRRRESPVPKRWWKDELVSAEGTHIHSRPEERIRKQSPKVNPPFRAQITKNRDTFSPYEECQGGHPHPYPTSQCSSEGQHQERRRKSSNPTKSSRRKAFRARHCG